MLDKAYSVLAPFYNAFVAPATVRARRRSLATLEPLPAGDVLIVGIGTGLDLPYLPVQHHYVGIDLTLAMLMRVPQSERQMALVRGDAMHLPFRDNGFDNVVLHLIVAVLPSPVAVLAEAARVVKPGGKLLIFDKFLRRHEVAPLRRTLSHVTRRVATRLDVVFEDLLAEVPGLELVSDDAALFGGWFRLIVLQRRP
jgi:phosphatidylethanolamine/phosphatidyl-N-methylethanolamine N-methyltransferase